MVLFSNYVQIANTRRDINRFKKKLIIYLISQCLCMSDFLKKIFSMRKIFSD